MNHAIDTALRRTGFFGGVALSLAVAALLGVVVSSCASSASSTAKSEPSASKAASDAAPAEPAGQDTTSAPSASAAADAGSSTSAPAQPAAEASSAPAGPAKCESLVRCQNAAECFGSGNAPPGTDCIQLKRCGAPVCTTFDVACATECGAGVTCTLLKSLPPQIGCFR